MLRPHTYQLRNMLYVLSTGSFGLMQILKRLNSWLKTPHLCINRILFHSFPPGPTFRVKGDVSTLRRNVPHGTAQVFRLLTRHTESRTPPQHRKWELRTLAMITTEATPFLVRSSRRLKLRCQEFRLGCMKLVVTQQAVGFHVGQPAEFALVNGIWMQVGWKASCWFQSRFCIYWVFPPSVFVGTIGEPESVSSQGSVKVASVFE